MGLVEKLLLTPHVAILEQLPDASPSNECWTSQRTCAFLDQVVQVWPSWEPSDDEKALPAFSSHYAWNESDNQHACSADEWSDIGAGCSRRTYDKFVLSIWIFWERVVKAAEIQDYLFDHDELKLLARLLQAVEIFCMYCLDSTYTKFEKRVQMDRIDIPAIQHWLVQYWRGVLNNMLHFIADSKRKLFRADGAGSNLAFAGTMHACSRDSLVIELGERLDNLYFGHGYPLSRLVGTSRRRLDDPSMTESSSGFFPHSFGNEGLELLLRLREVFEIRRAFVIGNAFGYSTLAVAEIWRVPVDAIDPSEHSACKIGADVMQSIAVQRQLDVKLYMGWSPMDIPNAVGGQLYDLVIIDGHHSDEQIVVDFEALLAYLLPRCVVILDDIWDVTNGLKQILAKHSDFTYATYQSPIYRVEHFGILHKGFGGSLGIFHRGLSWETAHQSL